MKGLRQKSEENWLAAKASVEAGRVNAASSRLYYSVFQAAYLLSWCRPVKCAPTPVRKDEGSKHVAMIRYVGSTDLGDSGRRDYTRLRALREKADYEQEPVTQSEYDALVGAAERIRDYCLKKT